MIRLQDVCKHYAALPHQDKALDYLVSLLSNEELVKFANMWRQTPGGAQKVPEVKNKVVLNIKLISQRDIKGDANGDGKLDKWQMCNCCSVAMAVNYLTSRSLRAEDVDAYIRKTGGSRYSHASLAAALGHYGVQSTFSTNTKIDAIISSIKSGSPVIWSGKLTRSGHIIVLGGWDEEKQAFLAYDSFGEYFASGYKDIRKPYWIRKSTLMSRGMNAVNSVPSSGEWAHLLKKI